MMKKSSVIFLGIAVILTTAFGTACTKADAGVQTNGIIDMELTADYDNADPFINEQLFCVTEYADTVEFGVSFELEGQGALLEIADNESKEVLWSEAWDEPAEPTQFNITLTGLEKEKEYVVRFTGVQIKYGRVVMTTTNSLVKERAKPQKKTQYD